MTDSSDVIAGSVAKTLESGPMRVRIEMSYRARDERRQWSAFGYLDPAAGRARFQVGLRGGGIFSEKYLDGGGMHTRTVTGTHARTPDGPWREERRPASGASDLVEAVVGLLRILNAVSGWSSLDASEQEGWSGFHGRAPRRLERWTGSAFPVVFTDLLPSAVIRRRAVEVYIDDEQRLRRLSLTANRFIGFGGRWQRLQLDLSDFGEVHVEPPNLDSVSPA